MYKYLDRMLKALVRTTMILFRDYRRLPFDELNVIPVTADLYNRLERANKDVYLTLYRHYYAQENPARELEDTVIEAYVDGVLDTPNAVTKYTYSVEAIRKRDRLVEALVATGGDVNEIEKAMRLWTQMFGWFGVEIADAAMKQARSDKGVSYVRWVAEDDEKTCVKCARYDGRIYPLLNVPPKPHPNCRCYTILA